MLNNDIIGSDVSGSGRMDNRRVSLFSEDPIDSPSRELARYIREIGERYVPSMDVDAVFRSDRFGRGGDHTPFNQEGFAAVRFSSPAENFANQHTITDTFANTAPEYIAHVIKVNGAAAASLALAPTSPEISIHRAERAEGHHAPAYARPIPLRCATALETRKSGAGSGRICGDDAPDHSALLGTRVLRRQCDRIHTQRRLDRRIRVWRQGNRQRWQRKSNLRLRAAVASEAEDRDVLDWSRCILFAVDVYLVDGTYELFRHFYALPSAREPDGRDVAAARGVLASVRGMIDQGATHIGVATDHVIESFRNPLWPGYKTGEGIDPALFAQFELLEEALSAMGVVVWPMVEFEADDALASAAALAAADNRVDRVIICTPDKDLSQCVRGSRVVQMDRRTRKIRDEGGVALKFGVLPESIPDYLALVGDAADGFPGLRGWGAKSSSAVLAKFGHLESIPADWREWRVNVSSAASLAATLERDREQAMLFRTLATLRTDIPLFESVDELRWTGPTPAFADMSARLNRASTG